MMLTVRSIVILLFVPSFWPAVVHAHGDADRPLYVTASGTDSGDCTSITKSCRTIGYALSMAAKGAQIEVGGGAYVIDSAEDVFHLISGVVQVTGGHALGETAAPTVLEGVPFVYRDELQARGFQIVSDQKGLNRKDEKAASDLLKLHGRLKSSIAATPCVAGIAAGLPCDDVDLLSHVGFVDISATPSIGNDIWGFVDLNTHREYALVGFDIGTAVFDVTDAESPREVGFVDGQSATWRDIKVYQFFDDGDDRFKAYAYVTTDGSTDGLFVIDLTDLPHSIRRVSYPSDMFRAHNVYATNTDYSTGLSLTGETPTLIIAGSSIGNGRYRSYSLADPENPAFISGGNGIGYMHDAASMLISDARKDTQCVNASDLCEVLFDFNEDSFEIWDVSTSGNPVRLSNTPYGNSGYVHSGWWSEDKQFVFVHDELDERNLQLATTVRVFDISNLAAPQLAGTWTGPTNAIDHNGFVRGNRYYMSNYSRGLTVLNITDASNPVTTGRLDTYPATDGSMFVGAWGAYPYYYSGYVAVSDIDSGFYMAEDQTRDVPQGQFNFALASAAADEGQSATLTVNRDLNSTGAVSVGFEILNVTASSNDYAATTGRLDWTDGDTTARSIVIDAVNDGVSEALEFAIVRLINPTGGATLGNLNQARVHIADPGAAAEVAFYADTIEVAERGFATAVPVIRRTGNVGTAASVDYTVIDDNATAGTDYTGATNGTLTWAAGDGVPQTIEFAINDDGDFEPAETFRVQLSNPVGMTVGALAELTVTIADGSGSNVAPSALAGINQTRAAGSTVTLDGSQSSDSDGDNLTFAWSQDSGPAVTLNNADTAVASFTAPSVTSDSLLQFSLTVSDPSGLSDTAVTTVTVTQSISVTPTPSSGGGGGSPVALLLLLTTLTSLRGVRRTTKQSYKHAPLPFH